MRVALSPIIASPAVLLAVLIAFPIVLACPRVASGDVLDYREPYLREIGSVPASRGVMEPVLSGNLLIVPVYHAGLRVYSIDDPSNPVLVGSLAVADVEGLALNGNLAVLACGTGGISVVSIAAPSTPVLLGTLDTPGQAVAVASSGSRAYVADRAGGFHVITIADPAHPLILWTVPMPGEYGEVTGVALTGAYALVACGDWGVFSYEITQPGPILRDELPELTGAEGIAISEHLAAIPRGRWGLAFLDVGNPRDLIWRSGADGYVDHLSFAGSHLLAMSYRWGPGYPTGPGVLTVLDLSNPSAPELTGTVFGIGDGSGAAIAGDMGYTTDGGGSIRILDARNLASPPVIHEFSRGEYLVGAVTSGPLAMILGVPLTECPDPPTLRIVDLSYPTGPFQVGYMDFMDLLWEIPRLAVSGDLLFLPFNDMLKIISIADPSTPREIGSISLDVMPNAVAPAGGYAVATARDAPLQVIDISNPSSPSVVATFAVGNDAQDIVVDGQIAWVALGTDGIDVIDLSNPLVPSRLSRVDTPGHAGGIALAGPFVFVADREAGMTVVDRSCVTAPFIVSTTPTPHPATCISVDRGIAYVGEPESGFHVVDVHNAAAPELIADVPIGDVIRTEVLGDELHLLLSYEGYEIRPIQSPLATDVPFVVPGGAVAETGLRITPNPARGTTRISLAADVPDQVQVTIFEVTGRRVRQLRPARSEGDAVTWEWDGSDASGRAMPSGVYLVRAIVEGRVETARATLIR